MTRLRTVLLLILFFLFPLTLTAATKKTTTTATAGAPDASILKSMQWRLVGPFRGGRADAVEGIASDRDTYYFGATGGGVWKTTDGGQTWKSVSDGFFGGTIGAIAVAPSDPAVVYVGTGEETIRGNVSPGAGMWKSTDAGKTWTHIGLDDSQHVGRIRVHPANPDLVYVAAMGHAFGPNQMRGVYRSRDGGKTWERILFVNPDSGAVDLAMDPTNPRILYASTWRFRRGAYFFESGGEGSALWKSTDGGDTWKELSRNKGMPKGTLGIIGVSVSPTNPNNVYAIVEAKDGGVYRSRDGGDTWAKVSSDSDLRQRAWYYTRIYADPKDEDSAYVVNVRFHKTKDGGKTWIAIPTPHGDNHDLWIAPNDPQRMIEANDGGVNVTTDGGATWTTQMNQPTAQFYRVSVDNDFPYRLLGPQQDNTAVRIRHATAGGGIGPKDWDVTAGGESGYIVADPTDPDIVYGGSYGGLLTVLNHRTGSMRDINPWPDNPMGAGDVNLKHRFQWNFPVFFSPNDPHKLYAASQYLLQTTNGGNSWQVISPDLTRNDPAKMQPTGGPITKDNTSVEYYCTIFYGAESPVEPGVIWVGSDDGLIHVTRDGGQHWDNVTPPKSIMPEWIMVNEIDASPIDKGTAYVAATMYKWDDFRPYLYKTSDYGKTWTKITEGIPANEFTRVVRADPKRRGLLYAGTERGVYVSFDDGGHWQSLQYKLPTVPIADLLVHQDALIAATHGRAFWMLDDLEPLRQLTPDVATRNEHLFTPSPTLRMEGGGRGFGFGGGAMGANPPYGAVVDFLIRDQKPGTNVSLAFLGPDGKVLREFKGKIEAEAPKAKEVRAADVSKVVTTAEATESEQESKVAVKSEGGAAEQQPSAEAASEEKEEAGEEGGRRGRDMDRLTGITNGHNRFAWNLRMPEAKRFPGLVMWSGGTLGPRVLPGTYQARLTVGDLPPQTVPFEIRQDPRTTASAADLKAQFDFVMSVHDKLSQTNEAISHIRDVRRQLTDVKKRVGKGKEAKPIVDAANDLDKKITAIEETLYQTKNHSPEDPLNFPIKLNDKLAGVGDSAALGFQAPTSQQIAVRDEILKQIDAELAKLDAIWKTDLPAFNKLAQSVPVVSVPVK